MPTSLLFQATTKVVIFCLLVHATHKRVYKFFQLYLVCYFILRGVKEVQKRDGTERKSRREIIVGKLKTASSKRIVPLNETAIQAIIELRNERYFGEDAPLIPDADGNFTRPLNLRKRFYSILDAAVIEKKGLHSLRHTFATKLVTGVRAED